MSVVCFTTSLTAKGSSLTSLESGSDYISRGHTNVYRVTFKEGVTTASCDVKVFIGLNIILIYILPHIPKWKTKHVCLLPYEYLYIITRVWLDQFWRSYFPCSLWVFHQNICMYNSSYILNVIVWFDFCVFNATFNNISAISWRPVLVVEEDGVPGENHRPWASNW